MPPSETQITPVEKTVRKRQSLEYPLNNPDEYLGRLKFTVLKEPETDLEDYIGVAADAVRTENGDEDDDGDDIRPLEDRIIEGVSFHGRDRVTQRGVNELINTGRSVKLYMPTGLAFRDTVNYENFDVGGVGAGVETALKTGGSAAKSILDGGTRTLSAAFGGAASKDLAKLATVKLASRLPDEVAGAFKSAGQVTTNPNTRVLFRNVNLREFVFNFKFIAVSQKESEEVKEIIRFFRTELYPENIKVRDLGISIGYRFPNKFRIEVLYKGRHITPRIKPCFLRDVNVTYNPSTMAMHGDGNFSEIEMSLAFQEHRTLSREDVEGEGGY